VRGHREIAERRRDEAEGVERSKPCSGEGRREREPAVELEIQHPAQTCGTSPAPTRERPVDPVGQRRPGQRERPRQPRGVASSITWPSERRRRDDRSGESPAERECINRVQVVRLPVIAAGKCLRDQELLKKERADSCSDELQTAAAVIACKRDRGDNDRDDSSTRDTNPPCAHACA